MHDLFKNKEFTERVVNNLARMKGLVCSDLERAPPASSLRLLASPSLREGEVPFSQDAEFDKLAAHLRRHIDFAAIYESMGLAS